MVITGTRAKATSLSLCSWVLFACSGPLAAVLLGGFVTAFRPAALRFRREDLPLLLGYGPLGVAGVQLFFFVAVDRVPVGIAMVLVNLAPALVALWVRVVRRSKLPALVWLGLALALAGLAMVAEVWNGARLDLLGVSPPWTLPTDLLAADAALGLPVWLALLAGAVTVQLAL